jgi:malonyl-CoA/methylmalonyl-CoA synthetase
MARPAFLDRFLAHPADRPALTWEGRERTYGELRAWGESTAGWLAAEGVRPGDRVAIQLENGPALVAAHLGCMALGAVRVPLNAHYREAEVAPIVEDAAPVLVITATPGLFPGCRTAPEPGVGAPISAWAGPDDVTALLFTSGTTGRPKGVPQTWTMWTHNLDALAARWALGADDVLWLTLPLFHTHGLVLGLHGALLRGARVLLASRFDPVPPPAAATHFYGVPTYYRRWLPLMEADPASFAHLRLLVSGSDGLSAEVNEAVFRATGKRVLERYGMTETVMITSNPFDGERRAGTVGTPLDATEVRVQDGEVQVRGPSVFGGYWPRPDPGAFTPDGFFRTGDAGEWDERGYLRLVGRKKDLVIVGGVNVSPAEVEAVLAAAPGVAEVGCCGLADADLNEIVAAAVVLDGTRSEGDTLVALRAAAQGLSGLKRPRRYAFVPALPRNALGKLQRGRIAKEVAFPDGAGADAAGG